MQVCIQIKVFYKVKIYNIFYVWLLKQKIDKKKQVIEKQELEQNNNKRYKLKDILDCKIVKNSLCKKKYFNNQHIFFFS